MRSLQESVTVIAPARLHMGFFDMHGGLGRRFGGLGLALTDIATRVRFTPSPSLECVGAHQSRAQSCAEALIRVLGLSGGVRIEVLDAIPAHVGLGSGTQIALAVAAGIARVFGLEQDLTALARLLDRGVRSGIGLGAFNRGGFVVDGGRGPDTSVPPLIAQLPFPEAWRVLLIFDHAAEGLSGTTEALAFKQMPPMSAELASHLCRLVLMRILPAVAEADYPQFSAGITEVQSIVGDYFASYQGGRYSSQNVAAALRWLELQEKIPGVGQSSWGPTGFAVIEGEAAAHRIAASARERWSGVLEFKICQGNNQGAAIIGGEQPSFETRLVSTLR